MQCKSSSTCVIAKEIEKLVKAIRRPNLCRHALCKACNHAEGDQESHAKRSIVPIKWLAFVKIVGVRDSGLPVLM